jgi:DNA-binding IclR family transcriptional regulator
VLLQNYISPAALHVVGPEGRFSLSIMTEHLEEIRASLARISHNLVRDNAGEINEGQ